MSEVIVTIIPSTPEWEARAGQEHFDFAAAKAKNIAELKAVLK